MMTSAILKLLRGQLQWRPISFLDAESIHENVKNACSFGLYFLPIGEDEYQVQLSAPRSKPSMQTLIHVGCT